MALDEQAKGMYREMLVGHWNTMTTFLGKVEAKVGNTKDVEKAWKSLDAMMNAVMKACGIPKSEIVSEEEEEAQVPESTE